MLAFIVGLWANPLARKVLVYGAALLAILFAFRLWIVRHDDKIYQQGKVAATEEVEKAKQAEWAQKEKTIAADAAKVATDRNALESQRAELVRSRQALQSSLNQSLAKIQQAKNADIGQVCAIPADQLDGALRAISADLAASH